MTNTINGQYSQRFCDERHRTLEEEINRRFNEMIGENRETKEKVHNMQRVFYMILGGIIFQLIGIIGIFLRMS